MRIRIAIAGLVAAASVASAQTQPGITFKIRTQLRNHPVPEKSKPDSVRIKRLEAAAAARAADDIAVGDAPPAGGRGNPAGGRGAGVNNVLMMNGFFIKGFGRMDVQGVIGTPE